ncbi:exonuclease SbcC [Hymenobacter daecheongensis DSM 21074]|uniref:Exonuclease SbcC n=1 Tax=Hymenobacter daecheongensis DSM 21074 TaxID=1121955 RepID=A0A1M6M1T2_9BACT|nr:SbcC/MukB-like Walker B domain-containing protein [Hymenobacter daecheongensis]SHJ77300.1 exonuclease SbcC [Hymenobacter daecheongensis DSM 21074]
MKIISVSFSNLNSLLGDFTVRFDEAPLADTGLFAITGPTGAGKSTLLDAIAVALYGRVPRHGKQVEELVSRHASRAHSAVEFEVMETDEVTREATRVRYRSRWEIKRKSRGKEKGELGEDSMVLTCLRQHKDIETLKTRVQQKVVELSGLEFGQFEQSVLLAQGAFAKFLKARESERSALLEKITDVRQYKEISIRAFRQAAAAESQMKQLRAQLNFVQLLSAEARATLDTELSELLRQSEQHDMHAARLQEQLAWRRQLLGLTETIAQTQQRLAQADVQAELLAPLLRRLTDHERAEPLAAPLARAADARQLVEAATAALHHTETQLPAAALRLRQATETAATHRQAWQQAEVRRPVREQLLNAADQQDHAIGEAANQLTLTQKAHDDAQAEAKRLTEARQRRAQELAELQAREQSATDWLIRHQHERELSQQIIAIQRDLEDLGKAQSRLLLVETELTRYQAQADAATRETTRLQQEKQILEAEQQAILTEGKPLREEEQQLLAGQSVAELEQVVSTRQAHRERLGQLHILAAQFQARSAVSQQQAQAYADGNQELETALVSQQSTATKLLPARQELELRRRIARQQRLIVDLNAQRAHLLSPHADCPLCGAAPAHHTHPADFRAELGDDERQEELQQQLVQALETELAQHDIQVARLQAAQAARLAAQQEAQTDAQQAHDTFAEWSAGHTVPALTTPLPDWQAQLEAAAQDYTAAQHQLSRLREVQRKLAEFREKWNDTKPRLSTLEAQLAATTQQYAAAQEQLRGELPAKRQAEQEAVQDYMATVNSLLLPHALRYDGRESAGILSQLQERADALEQQQTAHKKLEQELEALKKLVFEAQTQLDSKTQLLQTQHAPQLAAARTRWQELLEKRRLLPVGPDPAAERAALEAEMRRLAAAREEADNALVELQKQEYGLQEAIRQQHDALAKHQAAHAERATELQAELSRLGLADADQARTLLLPEAEAADLRRRRDQQQHERRDAEKQLAEAHRQHDALLTRALTDLSEAELLTRQLDLKAQSEAIQQQRGQLVQQLRQDDDARQRQTDHQLALEKLELEFQRWDDLSKLIGSATGDAFSKFAQGLTLAHLVGLANERLHQLSTRYTILKTPHQDLTLQIIDHDQADSVRTMNSLSGGESFLVSLALALGLSELAGHKAQIESLFIDEGFGTLDPDTLNVALDALEKLQHSGKMIGVISHVAELKSRITTQVQVIPARAGNSTIRILDAQGQLHSCVTRAVVSAPSAG